MSKPQSSFPFFLWSRLFGTRNERLISTHAGITRLPTCKSSISPKEPLYWAALVPGISENSGHRKNCFCQLSFAGVLKKCFDWQVLRRVFHLKLSENNYVTKVKDQTKTNSNHQIKPLVSLRLQSRSNFFVNFSSSDLFFFFHSFFPVFWGFSHPFHINMSLNRVTIEPLKLCKLCACAGRRQV